MENKYSQWKALMAIARGSFKAVMKSPQTLFFSVLFPLIFIFIFGSFKDGGFSVYTLGLSPKCDTANEFYLVLKNSGYVKILQDADSANLRKRMEKGDIAGILDIQPTGKDSLPKYQIKIRHTNATEAKIMQLQPFFENLSFKLAGAKGMVDVDVNSEKYEVRPYRRIDFVLPGQIGFSILFSTLFGIAFTFYTLREQLILKRFYATPINRLNILLGIGSSRIIFQLLSVIVLVGIGHFFLGFTLVQGWVTFVDMLIITILMLFLLMGVGLIFSSIVKTDSGIPLLINIFSLPQILLAGTFFSTDVFPSWMQQLCQILPLTHFNNAMRKIAFEGATLLDCGWQIGILCLWILVVYLLAIRVFKWE